MITFDEFKALLQHKPNVVFQKSLSNQCRYLIPSIFFFDNLDFWPENAEQLKCHDCTTSVIKMMIASNYYYLMI